MRHALVMTLPLLLCATTGSAEQPAIQRLAPGITAVLQPTAGWVNDSNATVVATSGGVLVVDAPADPTTVQATIDHIDNTDIGGVRFLINTHWHSDHTQGNQLYRQRYGNGITIIGHRSLMRDVPERAGGYIAEQIEQLATVIPRAESQLEQGLSLTGEALDEAGRVRQRDGIAAAKEQLSALEDVELLPPDLSYNERLTLHLGDTEVRLLRFAAHTDGDTLVYLPDQKILLGGDVVDVMPFAGHGHLGRWIEALDELAKLDIERIVPGHGPVLEGKGQIERLRRYFGAILDGTRAAVARGDTLAQAREVIDLEPFRRELAGDDPSLQRHFDAFAPEAITRAWAEAEAALGEAD